ncbi:50S ribosomal protein L23 [Patescibacteria group bacterium]|nr:50S ribosomal protein L23 [Patescibacteria group bacterium]
MGIFKRKTSVTKKDSTDENKKVKKVENETTEVFTPESQQEPVKGAKKEVQAVKAKKGQAGMSYKLLLAPVVSEKAAVLASNNVYVFQVPVSAEKVSIAKAVQDLYGVTVIDIRTARGNGKRIFRGSRVGHRKQWKKAFVVVKKGQTIDLYEGV